MLAEILLPWYDRNRRVLPFRGTRDPYRVWVSEIMLQQTRTETVSSYYERFLKRFPDVFSLAAAPEMDVLKCWEGLGYYSRARNLHAAAKQIVSDHGGAFPADERALRSLPGVGAYTAAAVASIAFDLPCPAVDGNLTRVLARVFGVREDVGIPSVKRLIDRLAAQEMPSKRCGEFNQALMDLGATICKPGTPDCESCPLFSVCDARREDDADRLPILSKKTPPREIDLSVIIVTRGGRVFLCKRAESLLRGLYVFCLNEGKPSLPNAARIAAARHVFTHRVWNMTIYHAEAPDHFKADGVFASRRDMLALPMPTAMKAAKAEAIKLLTPEFIPIDETNITDAASVYSRSWQDAHRRNCSPDFLEKHTPEYFAGLLREHLENGQSVYAATLRGRVIGALVFDENIGEINHLYLDPAYQGAGCGRDAMQFMLSRMTSLPRITIDVLTNNVRARALYAAFGFRDTNRVTVLNERTGLSEIVMERGTEGTTKTTKTTFS